MSKVIRLDEKNFHKLIKESVNKILTELDWRTYYNAAKKADEKGDDKLSRKFKTHAQFNSSNKIFPEKFGKYSAVNIDYDEKGNPMPWGMKKDSWGDYEYIEGFGDDTNGGYKISSTAYPNQTFGGDPSYLGKNASDYYKELEKQAKDYNNGKSKYTKGKGWE